jgi:hypothetical protein
LVPTAAVPAGSTCRAFVLAASVQAGERRRVHDGPRLSQRRIEERGVPVGLGGCEEHVLSVPRLDPIVAPESPAKRAGAPESVAREPPDPIRRPLFVHVSHTSLAGNRRAEENSWRERAEVFHEPVADGGLQVLGDLEAQDEIGRSELTTDRTFEIVLEAGDSWRR